MPKRSKGIGIYLTMLLVLMLVATYAFSSMNTETESYNYTEIISYFQKNQVGGYSLDLGTGELVIDSMIERLELEKPRELTKEELAWIAEKETTEQFRLLSEEAQAALSVEEAEKYKADLEEQKKLEELQAIKEIRKLEAEGRIFYKDSGHAVIFRKMEEPIIYKVPNVGLFVEDTRELVLNYNRNQPVEEQIVGDYVPAQEMPWWISVLPTLLLIGLMVVFWVVIMRQSRGGGNVAGFGKAKAKSANEGRKVTFDDVAGADEEKEELIEVVEFLKSPSRFNALGARIPKGVLLMGPPGTGKTLLARAVAGEAGVHFFSISGSDFVEMFVGVGASRVRDLFDQAKKNAPSVIFIDEIDAVGRQRGAGLGGGHDEREQTLNQLLVEMDGFSANTGVIIIAATNRSDILDRALLRPGRFDRQIVVGYPDIKGREEILKVHSRNKPIGPDVNLATIAKTTAGFTGADLENLINEAALLAARKNLKAITMQEIEEATIKVVAGPEKRSHVVTEKDKRLTAYHEAGHALCTYYCPTQDPVHQVSIIPRGMAGGYTMSLPAEDRNYVTKTNMYETIVVLMGGRVAELLILDDISTGASNDLERATKTAREMVTRYGFSERIGPIVYSSNPDEVFLGRDYMHSRDFSENVASEIDTEVRNLMDRAYKTSIDIVSSHMGQLHEIAEYLIEKEKIDAPTFEKLMRGELQKKKDDPFGLNIDPFGLRPREQGQE